MADDTDRASDLEQLQRDNAIHNQLNKPAHQPMLIDGVRCCLDCEEEITDRLEIVPNAVRCVDCQDIYERQHKLEL